MVFDDGIISVTDRVDATCHAKKGDHQNAKKKLKKMTKHIEFVLFDN